jgi:DNA-binding SARP family transcriptional activator
MDFQILGPVELWGQNGRVEIGPLKQRTVLAAMLVDAGRPVTQELLINRVWDDWPPVAARETLYTYVARLRRILASVPGGENASLLRRSGGYLFDVDPETVDLHRFSRLAAEAGSSGLSEEQRCELAGRALTEFAAVPLTDLTSQWADRVREHLVRRRRDMIRLHATLKIRLGGAASVVDSLRAALVDEPLAEDLVGMLMSSLCFSGRRAEALELFARTRASIAAELGVEPGPELSRTHEQILRGELARPAFGPLMERPSYQTYPAPAPADGDRHAAPAQVGTSSQASPDMKASGAVAAVESPGRSDGPERTDATVVALVGGSDLEKSMLAIHVAQQVRAAYLKGHLSARHSGAPADTVTVLNRRVGRAGKIPQLLPEPGEKLADLYRGLLAGGRILVVLDGPEYETLVAALLPAQSASA